MIIVYKGERERISVDRPVDATFDRGVPTHVPDGHAEYLSPADFEPYNPDVHTTAGRPILYRTPTGFGAAVHCVNVAKRLAEVYPTCEINVLVPPEAAALPWPDRCRPVTTVSNQGPDQWYRTFRHDMGIARNMYGLVHLGVFGWTRRAWMDFGIARPDDPKEDQPWERLPSKGHVVIARDGRKMATMWAELADVVAQIMRKIGYDVHVLGAVKPDNAVDAVELIRTAGFYVGAGDSPLNLLAAHAGISSAVFLPDTLVAKKAESFQLCQFGDHVKWATIGGNVEKVAAGVAAWGKEVIGDGPKNQRKNRRTRAVAEDESGDGRSSAAVGEPESERAGSDPESTPVGERDEPSAAGGPSDLGNRSTWERATEAIRRSVGPKDTGDADG